MITSIDSKANLKIRYSNCKMFNTDRYTFIN